MLACIRTQQEPLVCASECQVVVVAIFAIYSSGTCTAVFSLLVLAGPHKEYIYIYTNDQISLACLDI